MQAVFEMLDAGLSAPFIGRFRRGRTGAMSEVHVRRVALRREELQELDRRRGTVLRSMERIEGISEKALDEVRQCMDRFELEDLYVPYRRPEPEVQLAMDRGLGALADLIVKPMPKEERVAGEAVEAAEEAAVEEAAVGEAAVEAPRAEESAAEESPAADVPAEEPSTEAVAEESQQEGPKAEEPVAEAPVADAADSADSADSTGDADAADHAAPGESEASSEDNTPSAQPEPLVMTAELSKLCEPFVNPDKGVHTDVEALAGAIRILSDRIGRDSRLRGHVRRIMRKKGILRIKPIVDEKKAGRHKNLLKVKAPLRQLQGHRLTAIRQAQKERIVNTFVELDPKEVIQRVRASMGKHTRPEFEALLNDVARKALRQRLLPVVEADIRLEMKERGDAEALRFLAAHLRQILLTPFFGRLPVVGMDVSAKGDMAFAFLDMHGNLTAEARVEVGEKDDATLGAELVALLEANGPEAIAVGSGKSARAAGQKIRAALRAVNSEVPVMVVNDAGATSYANGQLAREELAEVAVPIRLAITMGRRLQDPMGEFLKVDSKQLSLGAEQRLVSKANLRRALDEAVASAIAFVGCDFDTAPRSVILNLPGLTPESAKNLADKRDAGEIESREQIRADGILTEAEWTSVAAFLRIRQSSEPLDRTSLHPEQYALARQLLESAGGSVEETLGRPGGTKGLRRQSFEVDEFTWRDLMRELSFPGRDPRGRNRVPAYISDDTDPVRLQKGRVLEGIVTNVASFGAFIDVGTKQDAMIHISELASRYVRDARELLSIGATTRARIVDGSSARMALSLKDVPAPERDGGGGGSHRGGARRGGSRRARGGRRGEPREDAQPKGPAGRIYRRDGAAGASTRSGGARRGGPRRGGADRFDRGERVDLSKLNSAAETPANNPFASFFKKDQKEQPKPAAPKAPKAPKAQEAPQAPKEEPKTEAPAE
ncbi:30S ribosomal protein S1 [Planctomycetes bacterium Poly30]|uniref:30S ribosomal protein S1 n=2 Tax=Saltatorellus ferox TaxID=2528018 RepID=A0A518EQM1_9BACT|nr:30S ribosomal protein S1 [Planctomycetes bacterium Poly30]